MREGQGEKGIESERDRLRKRFRELDGYRVREGPGEKGTECERDRVRKGEIKDRERGLKSERWTK